MNSRHGTHYDQKMVPINDFDTHFDATKGNKFNTTCTTNYYVYHYIFVPLLRKNCVLLLILVLIMIKIWSQKVVIVSKMMNLILIIVGIVHKMMILVPIMIKIWSQKVVIVSKMMIFVPIIIKIWSQTVQIVAIVFEMMFS